MPKVFYFVQRDRKVNQLGHEYSHWNVDFELGSKSAVRKAYTVGTRYVKASEIYSPEQMIERFSAKEIRRIVEEIRQYHPEKIQDKRKGEAQ